MNHIIGFDAPLTGDDLAHSALPNAPVVPERGSRARVSRTWTVATLRAVARRSDRLANRLDPVCA